MFMEFTLFTVGLLLGIYTTYPFLLSYDDRGDDEASDDKLMMLMIRQMINKYYQSK